MYNREDIIGLEKVHKATGMKMVVIDAYKPNKKWCVDIKFEDGQIAYNKQLDNFKNDNIAHPTIRGTVEGCYTRENLIGMEKIHEKTGLKMKIIEVYRSDKKHTRWLVDVEFEDGQVVYKADFRQFRNNKIDHPILTSNNIKHAKFVESMIGTEVTNKDGIKAKITNYTGSQNFEITFEDGTTRICKNLYNFKIGKFKYIPNRIGDTNRHNDGSLMTICGYTGSSNVQVRFEDGEVVKTTYANFKLGCVRHGVKKPKLGETGLNNKNKLMTIVECYGNKFVDVEFENGIIKKHRLYSEFLDGSISDSYRNIKIGCCIMCKVGLYATVIDDTSGKIKIVFEDGTVKDSIKDGSFKKCSIAHPKYRLCKHVGTFKNEKIFLCTCKTCKGKHVLKLSEMKNFECNRK